MLTFYQRLAKLNWNPPAAAKRMGKIRAQLLQLRLRHCRLGRHQSTARATACRGHARGSDSVIRALSYCATCARFNLNA